MLPCAGHRFFLHPDQSVGILPSLILAKPLPASERSPSDVSCARVHLRWLADKRAKDSRQRLGPALSRPEIRAPRCGGAGRRAANEAKPVRAPTIDASLPGLANCDRESDS